jgi:hypothetical protein
MSRPEMTDTNVRVGTLAAAAKTCHRQVVGISAQFSNYDYPHLRNYHFHLSVIADHRRFVLDFPAPMNIRAGSL